ncbi:MAG TPA: DsrE family protein [Usitatibacter sp.]|nr:DsrE family protein [Usitatibacter sp.]
MADKLVILCTHGPEAPERATIPFVMATAAQASDVDVFIGLQADAVALAAKGAAERVAAPSFPPLRDLLAAYLEAGGKLHACGPCLQARGIDAKTGLIEGASVANAAAFVKECTEATNVLVY